MVAVLVLVAGVLSLGPAAAEPSAPSPPTAGASPGTAPVVDDGGMHAGEGENGGAFATTLAWPTQQLTYGFVSTTPDLGAAATGAAFRLAFDVWEAAAGFTFTEVPSCTADGCAAADIRISFEDPLAECTDPLFLGCAYYPGQGAISGDVFMNDTYTWTDQAGGGDPDANTWDLVPVAVHEVGHAIGMVHTDPGGLCHFEATDPIMCAILSRSTRDLHPDDLTGIRALYLDGPPANDLLANATTLVGTTGTLTGSLSAATPDAPDPACTHGGAAGGSAGSTAADDLYGADEDECGLGTVWYTFEPSSTGRFVLRPAVLGVGSLGITVLRGPDAEHLTFVHERYVTAPPVAPPAVAFLAEAGHRYVIGLWNVLGDTGSFEVAWQHQPGVVQRFADVSLEHPLFDVIDGAAARGVLNGYADGTFRPGATVTRQAMAAFLFRQSGDPAPTGCTRRFRDVSPSHPFFAEICWAARTGLTEGYVDGTYRPGTAITRQAAARLLRRSVGGQPVTGCDTPFDVSPTHTFYGDVCWLSSNGITTVEIFQPSAPLSRQAAAAFLQRVHDLP
jgi:hypothetical protein